MKFKFWQREPEYYEEDKPKRKPETLASLSEKIIMKRMKADSEYGIQIAERQKKLAPKEDKSLMSQLQELKELRGALKDFGEGGGGSMVKQVLEMITSMPALMAEYRELQSSQSTGLNQGQLSGQLSTTKQHQIASATKEPEQKPSPPPAPKAQLSELLIYLDEEPKAVIEMLKARGESGDEQGNLWLSVLSNNSYEQVRDMLTPWRENPEFSDLIEQILSDNRKEWLKTVLKEARKVVI